MAWRFKASKFKNAAPIVPKPEACIRDICVGSYQTYGNNIAASAAFMAFNVDHNGSCLAVLPIDDCGRKSKTMPLLYAHTDTVTDMDFSPFHDGLLATGSQDCMVKVWHIPEKGLEENMTEADCTFSHKQRRVETVGFHPTADCLLHSTSYTTLTLWDLTAQAELYSNSEHGDVVQSVSWRRDGRILATSSKDKTLRVVDPRGARAVTHSAASHQSIKDSRVVWIGDSNRVLTTGFDSARQREVFIRDLRNFSQPEKTLVLDSSTGILIPLYDADTGMLFLAGKGDTTIAYLEVIEREPYLVEGIRHSGEQTKGACLVPKRTLNVMQAEVNRVLQLTSTTVIPIMYQVPRKSYRDFHADLFPETAAPESQLTAAAWMKGSDTQLNRLSLDPSQKQLIQVHRGSLSEMRQQLQESQKTQPKTIEAPKTYRNNIAAARNMFEKDKNENNEQRNKQTEIVKKTEDVQNDNDDDEKIIENGNKADVTPPKPLPRRANSLSESEEVVTQQKPVARPRTNSVAPTGPLVPPTTTASSPASAYKPRLGPKPFSPRAESESGASELDRVFSVPAAPSSPAATNGSQSHGHSPPDSPPAHTHTPNQEEGTNGEVEVSTGRGNVTPEVESGPRRGSSEADRDGEGERADGVGDAERGGGLERGGVRGSIAERRRLYENRSLSVQEPVTPSPTALRRRDSLKQSKSGSLKEEDGANGKRNSTVQAPKRTSTVFGRVSKFRHLKGTPAHKSAHIENIRNISRQISGECDGFHANSERVAVPLSGPGGKIAVFELSKTGKLADGVIPTLVHGTNVMDFAWDPFNERRLAVACDDGTIRLWLVPEGGLPEPTNAPDAVLEAHTEKIYSIKFHPLAQDVLASGSYDMTVRVWDLTRGHDPITLLGHTDQMFSLAWSSCGCLLATVCKDGVLRVYEPRRSPYPLAQGKGPVGTRGARVVWALDSAFIVVTGFDKVSERQIIVYERDDLSSPLATVGLDVSPAILIPFYDEDSSTLFLTGKGDSTIYAFEVCGEPPYVCALSHHRCASLHQGLSFLPKRACDVSIVEFAKAYRLTNTTIEPLSFTVPRIKSDLFQDDLFPMTRVTWEPTLSADQWFSSTDRIPQRVSLKPDHMDNLSEAQGAAGVSPSSASGGGVGRSGGGGGGGAETRPPPTTTTRLGWAPDHQAATKQKEQQLQQSVSSRVELNLKLEQDQMEGVDDREWIYHLQRMKRNLMLMEHTAADHSDGETNGGLPESALGTTRTLTSWLKSFVTPTSVRFKTEKISDAVSHGNPPKIGVVPVESAANQKACLEQSKIPSNLNKSPEVLMTIERDGAPQTVGVAVQTEKFPRCEIKDSNSQTEDLIWLYNRRVHFFGSIHTFPWPMASLLGPLPNDLPFLTDANKNSSRRRRTCARRL